MSSWMGEGLPPPLPPLKKEGLLLGRSLVEQDDDDEEELIFDHTSLLNRRHMSLEGRNSSSLCSRLCKKLRCCCASNAGSHLQVARTFNLCLSFFALGLCFAIPTATLDDLQKSVDAGQEVKNIYTARYSGYLFGALMGGFLFDRYNRQFLLFLSLLATGIGILVMPFCKALAGLMACTAVTGITMGFLDTGGNVWCLDLWGRRSAPVMQAMHFCFGLGAFLAPLVAEPFLTPHPTSMDVIIHNPLGGPIHFAARNNSSQLHVPWVGLPHTPLGGGHRNNLQEHVLNKGEPAYKRTRRNASSLNGTILNEALNGSFAEANTSQIEEHFTSSSVFNSSATSENGTSESNVSETSIAGNASTIAPLSTTQKVAKKKPEFADGNPLQQEPDPWKNWKPKKDHEGNLVTSPPVVIVNTTVAPITTPTTTTALPTVTPTNIASTLNTTESSLELNDETIMLDNVTDSDNVTAEFGSENTSLVNNPQSAKILRNEQNSTMKSSRKDMVNINSHSVVIMPTTVPTVRPDTVSSTTESSSVTATTSTMFSTILQTTIPSSTTISTSTTSKTVPITTKGPTGSPEIISSHDNKPVEQGLSTEPNINVKPTDITSHANATTDSSFEPTKETSNGDSYKAENHPIFKYNKSTKHLQTANPVPELKTTKKMVFKAKAQKTTTTTTTTPATTTISKVETTSTSTTMSTTTTSIHLITANHIPELESKEDDSKLSQFSKNEIQSNTHSTTSESPFRGKALPDKWKLKEDVDTDLPKSSEDAESEDGLKKESNRSYQTSEDNSTESAAQNNTEQTQKKQSDLFASLFDFLNQNKLGRFEIPYVLLSIYIFVVALVFLAFLCRNPRELRSKQDEELDHSWEPSPSFRVPMVSLMVLFFCLYVGMEVAVGELLETFATKEDLQLSRARGYFLPHLFWGSFAVARGLSICVAMQFSMRCMLLTNLSICLFASVMLVAGADKLEALLWIGIVLLGLGMAPLFPTAISWIEGYLRVTNKMASVFILGAAVGEILLPTVVSLFINQEPMVLMYVNVLVNALCFMCFLILCVMALRQNLKYAYKPSRTLYQLASTEDTDEGGTELLSRNMAAAATNGHLQPVRRKLISERQT